MDNEQKEDQKIIQALPEPASFSNTTEMNTALLVKNVCLQKKNI